MLNWYNVTRFRETKQVTKT